MFTDTGKLGAFIPEHQKSARWNIELSVGFEADTNYQVMIDLELHCILREVNAVLRKIFRTRMPHQQDTFTFDDKKNIGQATSQSQDQVIFKYQVRLKSPIYEGGGKILWQCDLEVWQNKIRINRDEFLKIIGASLPRKKVNFKLGEKAADKELLERTAKRRNSL